MVGLRAAPQPGLLQLDEIADTRALFDVRAWAEMRERADLGAAADARVDDHAAVEHGHCIVNRRVGQPRTGEDPAAGSDRRRALQNDAGSDHRVGARP